MEQNQIIDDSFGITNPYLQRMHAEADAIQAFLDESARLEDPTSLTIRLNAMDAYQARLSDMMVRAKAMKEKATNRYVEENGDRINKLTATVSNRMISAHLYEYTVTYTRLETMYHTLEHLSRNLVTQISYIKEQMKMGL